MYSIFQNMDYMLISMKNRVVPGTTRTRSYISIVG